MSVPPGVSVNVSEVVKIPVQVEVTVVWEFGAGGTTTMTVSVPPTVSVAVTVFVAVPVQVDITVVLEFGIVLQISDNKEVDVNQVPCPSVEMSI